jgi:hypothetical protein
LAQSPLFHAGNQISIGVGQIVTANVSNYLPNGGGDTVITAVGTNYRDNQWHHVTMTRKENLLSLYMDGQLVDTTPSTQPLDAVLYSRLGVTCTACTQAYYAGELDDWLVFDEALTAEMIATIVAGTFPAVQINEGFVPLAVPGATATTAVGTGQIPADAPTGVHTFEEEVDVAFNTNVSSVLADPISNTDLRFYLPFEEAPGFVGNFENPRGIIDPGYTGEVIFGCMSEATCPITGVRGRAGRGVYFDGQADKVTTFDHSSDPAFGYGFDGATLSAWVKPESGSFIGISNLGSPNGILSLDRHGLRFISYYGISGTYEISYQLPQNEWSFITVVIGHYPSPDVILPYIKYYVNGQLVETLDFPGPVGTPCCGMVIGGNFSFSERYKGYLDEIRSYMDAFTDAEVLRLYQESVPLLQFQFDEDKTATTFIDSTENQYIGVPAQKTTVISGTAVTLPNPTPGTDGKIGNVATFDGTGIIEVQDATALNNLYNNFSVMGWMKPSDFSTVPCMIGHGNAAGNDGWALCLSAWVPGWACGCGPCSG